MPKSNKSRAARHEAPLDASASQAASDTQAASATPASGYSLRLYITGATNRSTRAIRQIQSICDRFLPGNYALEIVDLYEQPGRAAEGQVIAAPTLVKETPAPSRRMVGDLSDERRVLSGLGLSPPEPEVA
jgi:circadian clock protein KaiB